MKVLIRSDDLLNAVDDAFGSMTAFQKDGSSRLNKEELLALLVAYQAFPAECLEDDEQEEIDCPLDGIKGVPWGAVCALRDKSIHSLRDLARLTYTELLAIPGIGVKCAEALEANMASLNLSLKDRPVYQAAPEERSAEHIPVPEGDTEAELRQRTCRAIYTIAETLMDNGMLLMRLASKVAESGRIMRDVTIYSKGNPYYGKKYAAADVVRVCQPLLDLEKAEPKPPPPAPKRRRRKAMPRAGYLRVLDGGQRRRAAP